LAEGSPRATQAAKLPLCHALLLGLVQGPTEVLPVSSSAHIALLSRLAGWPHAEQEAELRNSLEVALHAGTAAALALALRGELGQALRELDGRALASAALALAPPALAGYLMEQRLERRPSGPRALAAGLAMGAAAMAWADARPETRNLTDFAARDGLALGLAQALALLPGISRNGATLTAARARGFAREDAQALSWRAGLPVIAGAAGLKASRLTRSRVTRASGTGPNGLGGANASPIGPRFGERGTPPGAVPALAVGTGAAFLSTLACTPLIRPGRRARALWPFALYRAGLALAAVASSAPRSTRP
jgi:undecaprenyl-diphosphatase